MHPSMFNIKRLADTIRIAFKNLDVRDVHDAQLWLNGAIEGVAAVTGASKLQIARQVHMLVSRCSYFSADDHNAAAFALAKYVK